LTTIRKSVQNARSDDLKEMHEPRANIVGATVLGTSPDFSEVKTVLFLTLHDATPFSITPLVTANRYRDVVAPTEKWFRLCFNAVSYCGESGIDGRASLAHGLGSQSPPADIAAHLAAMRRAAARPGLSRERLNEGGNRTPQLVILESEKSLDHPATVQRER
jgi:hypothetical protein